MKLSLLSGYTDLKFTNDDSWIINTNKWDKMRLANTELARDVVVCSFANGNLANNMSEVKQNETFH